MSHPIENLLGRKYGMDLLEAENCKKGYRINTGVLGDFSGKKVYRRTLHFLPRHWSQSPDLKIRSINTHFSPGLAQGIGC